ncbi:hypothetical protein KUTeg_009832 [Tegillarca granosa]|uniref:vitamin-K-epoxide reductase (warfarin-sensitive) n=1 Tax=Tegillarca granosa TaxID=220873 RepID=A0ABQ9F508_TEGGR|nr:hypothetical protein KUTeg_009832 [Tegillarca granosa]
MAKSGLKVSRSHIRIRSYLLLLCSLGLILSLYAYYVEVVAEHNKSYKAMCDFSAKISCSKVFTSQYGRGFGLLQYIVGKDSVLNQPNSVFGIMFYIIQIVCAFIFTIDAAKIQVTTCIMANCGSVYLAYILYFVLEDFCVVCVSTYVVNALLLFYAIKKRRLLSVPAVQVNGEKKDS